MAEERSPGKGLSGTLPGVGGHKIEKGMEGEFMIGEKYNVQRSDGQWYTAKLIHRRINSDNEEVEYYVHYDGRECESVVDLLLFIRDLIIIYLHTSLLGLYS